MMIPNSSSFASWGTIAVMQSVLRSGSDSREIMTPTSTADVIFGSASGWRTAFLAG